MPLEDKVRPLGKGKCEAVDPMGCHLQFIQTIDGVGGCFNWAGGEKEFDALLKRNHGQGEYGGCHFTGTLVSFDPVNSAKTVKELTKRGFKLLGIQKGAHGDYKMHLYGLGFEVPNPARKKAA